MSLDNSAFDLAEAFADEGAVALKAAEFIKQFVNDTPLTKAQMTVLVNNIQ